MPAKTSVMGVPLPLRVHQTTACLVFKFGQHVVAIAFSDACSSRRPICFASGFIFLIILCLYRAAWSEPVLLCLRWTLNVNQPKSKRPASLCANRGLRHHSCATTNRKHVYESSGECVLCFCGVPASVPSCCCGSLIHVALLCLPVPTTMPVACQLAVSPLKS
jgi:hypothetical protein